MIFRGSLTHTGRHHIYDMALAVMAAAGVSN